MNPEEIDEQEYLENLEDEGYNQRLDRAFEQREWSPRDEW